MYLSKVTLASSGQAAALFARFGGNDAYSGHQMLWQLFTHASDRPFLFREEIGPGGRPEFYVLSQIAPTQDLPVFQVQTKAFAPQIHTGQRLAFKLRVNPTICVTDEHGKSRRHDVMMHAKHQLKHQTEPQTRPSGKAGREAAKALMHEAAQQWICDEKRLAVWGIQLDVLPEIERYTQHKGHKKSGRPVQFSSVDFQGILTVTDPERFLAQYAQGFGRTKGMGCGLMLIRSI
ncbi:type I-E CRISPR-associated protein Cas6/Cse3/CasE [Photobacterium galatheae]|uniref:CRISPR-associated protein Cse3 n=1 Tax=Photobacterium galatheae TaxID=1654360 RepID=A0A066RMN8_9GAMM|nr:type I-E CRISPR-associated protein Cas6/Cse3/CasE [Photobacterium galatheae]KDM91665.1 CRISPR-associated protein Cse3 [Photobacterium galatheae]MCM0151592.1 type I-E CRISPR-associated protein Cas6/Cse3/CasE [Photobacterium galatheae]